MTAWIAVRWRVAKRSHLAKESADVARHSLREEFKKNHGVWNKLELPEFHWFGALIFAPQPKRAGSAPRRPSLRGAFSRAPGYAGV
jgi:hypothetical protein